MTPPRQIYASKATRRSRRWGRSRRRELSAAVWALAAAGSVAIAAAEVLLRLS